MRIPVYQFNVDFYASYSAFNPLLLFAQKYIFAPSEQCQQRICYANAIVLIESGLGILKLKGQHYHVGPGSLVYIAAGEIHQWIAHSSDPMVQRCVYFDWSYIDRPDFHFQSDYFDTFESRHVQFIAPSPALELRKVTQIKNIAMWVSYFNTQTPQPEVLAYRDSWDFLKFNGAFQTFLHHFLACTLKHESQFDPRIERLLTLIDQSPLELSEEMLYEWAKELGLGKSRLHDLFKSNTGYTPHDYMKQLKFQLIAEELCSSSISITDIAQKYDFSSIHHFSKSFRKVTGLSPTKYKEKYRLER